MCAIAGFNWEDRDLILEMMRILKHRGPDSDGQAVLPGGPSLGHDRLAIIDLSPDGAQPMWNRDRSLCIVFNGQIFNYRELRKELEGEYPFRTRGDTEVLLALFGKHGVAGLERLNGIFAFAIWDVRRKALVVARDPEGVKPLYYAWDGKRFAFASEAKALLGAVGPPELDHARLPLYLALGFVPGRDTLLRGIRRLERGTYAELRDGALAFGPFWHPDRSPWPGSRGEAVREVRRVAEAAVRRQLLTTDRPVGLFLSGGIDSSALAGLSARVSAGPLRTFSTRFDFEMKDNYFNVDADIARRTASRLGAAHTEILVTAKDTLARLDRIAWHLDEPNGNHTAAATHLLAEEAAKSAAVILSGDGPDEIFGGYDRYHKSRMTGWARRLPLGTRRLAAGLLRGRLRERTLSKLLVDSDVDQYLAFWLPKGLEGFRLRPDPSADAAAVRRFFLEAHFGDGRAGDFENRMMETDRRTWLTDEALLLDDRMTAAWGTEGRVPWLDDELVRLALRIPSKWKIRRPLSPLRQGKRIWMEALADVLPAEVRQKEKTGWFSPMAKWLRQPDVRAEVKSRLAALPKEIVDPAEAVRLLDAHVAKEGYHLQPIWNLVALQAWCSAFGVKA